ncbi:hypothetical protein O9K51_01038 [Purpureocillium lavendulum]|uniref:Uncharacterized protein n=1 Tax=Purpureocillium lavendulum TaxID=1247861 RepID=A0AB34G696_9HYPO|nr:hypothetical protein O9K51_01038 [Purpureocillium lavendulum]
MTFRKGRGNVQFIQYSCVASQFNQVEDHLFPQRLEHTLLLTPDLESCLVETLPKSRPLGEMEGPRGTASRECLDVGEASGVFALDMSNVAEPGSPFESKTRGTEALSERVTKGVLFLHQRRQLRVQPFQRSTGGWFHDPGIAVLGVVYYTLSSTDSTGQSQQVVRVTPPKREFLNQPRRVVTSAK